MKAQNIRVTKGGRLVLPMSIRKFLKIRDGDILHVQVVQGEIRLQSQQEALRHIRALIRQHIPADVSLVEELLAERHTAAIHEAHDADH